MDRLCMHDVERTALLQAPPQAAPRKIRLAKPLAHLQSLSKSKRDLVSAIRAVRADKQLEQADPATLQLISEISQ